MPKPSLYARTWVAFTSALLLTAGLGDRVRAQARAVDAPPCSSCIALITTPGATLLVDGPLNGIEMLVRSADSAPDAVRAAVQRIEDGGGRAGLWASSIADAAAHPDVVPLVSRIVIDLSSEDGAVDAVAFRLKTRLTELRGASADFKLAIAGPAPLLASLIARGIGAYVDSVGWIRPSGPDFPAIAAAATPVVALEAINPQIERRAGRGDAHEVERWVLTLPSDVIEAKRLLSDVARTAPYLRAGLVAGGTASIRCGAAATATYLDPDSLDTIAVIRDCGDRPLAIEPPLAVAERITTSSGEVVVRVPAVEGRFADAVRVVGARSLSVREIVARHQAAVARQRRVVRQLISTGRMTLTFEAPGFPAPLAITSLAVIYTAPDRVEIEQRDVRINGIAFPGSRVPRLPLIEPERVASPPLAIALTDLYRYELEGLEEVDGVSCYVVRFEPVDRARSLFAGRAWIDAAGFAMAKVAAVQTGLRGPIVSSEQIDEFRRDGSAWLLARSEVRQIYEGAGHRTPIHRVLTIDGQEINPAAFEERRRSAYGSPSIMLRDTPDGFRYLQRERSAGDAKAAEPTLAGRADRVRTVAAGVILDPNISQPLPFAGLSYVDFNLFGTGTQFNGFFGGTYGQLAVAAPSLGGTRWQLGGRAFAIASSYNDRAFDEGRENYQANISQRPAHASVWLLRPLTARITARIGYQFDYTRYRPNDSTAATFVVPVSQSAHGLRVAIEGQWAGWSVSGWWSGARRAEWRRWGEVDGSAQGGNAPGYDPAHQDFQRIGATLVRSFVATPRLVGRVEADWMTGHDLDRFSRYAFGSFDNRLRGYPAALIRYDRGGVLRGSGAWAASRLLRLDGFLDVARVHDPGFGSGSKNYTGIGFAAEVPAPFGTLVAVEWGYGFQGINSDGSRGTQVVRVSGYKMF